MLQPRKITFKRITSETLFGCLMAFAIGFGMITVKPVAPPVPATAPLSEDANLPFDLEDVALDAAEIETINAGGYHPYLIDTNSSSN